VCEGQRERVERFDQRLQHTQGGGNDFDADSVARDGLLATSSWRVFIWDRSESPVSYYVLFRKDKMNAGGDVV
jgi:hypothetical protein